MRSAVDEITKGCQRGAETNHWAVEADNKDLGVRREGLRRVDVERRKVLEPMHVAGRVVAVWHSPWSSKVGTTITS